ncbi:MAG: hypothetical protein V4857_19385 [Pseudomonadota bacterium]
MQFVPVATPETESEMATMVCLLDAYGIQNFVHNRGFGGLYPGLQIRLYNVRRVMVRIDQASDALELLSSFDQIGESDADDKLALADKVRVIVETVFLGWSFPAKRVALQRSSVDLDPTV